MVPIENNGYGGRGATSRGALRQRPGRGLPTGGHWALGTGQCGSAFFERR